MFGVEDESTIRLLAVEDDPNDQTWLLALLEESTVGTYHISFAPTMADAEVSLTVGEVDCVLLDLSLPDSHGFESVERVAKVAPHVPIVVVTGQDDKDMGIRAIEFGAHDYLSKHDLTGDAVLQAARWAKARAASRGQGHGALSRLSAPQLRVARDARMLGANDAMVQLLRLEDESALVGQPVAGLIDEAFRPDFMRVCGTVLQGASGAMALPAKVRAADGHLLARIALVSLLGEDDLAELVVFFADPKPA